MPKFCPIWCWFRKNPTNVEEEHREHARMAELDSQLKSRGFKFEFKNKEEREKIEKYDFEDENDYIYGRKGNENENSDFDV